MKLFHANTCCGCGSLNTGSKIIAWLFIILNIIGLLCLFFTFIGVTIVACNSDNLNLQGSCGSIGLLEGMAFIGYCGIFGFGIYIPSLILRGLQQNRYFLLLPWIVVQCGSLVAMISFFPYMITLFSISEIWVLLIIILIVVPVMCGLLYHWISVVYTTMVEMAGPAWGHYSSHGTVLKGVEDV